jgi:small conductance mechanosensitive channel
MEVDIGNALNTAVSDVTGWLEGFVAMLPELLAAALVVVAAVLAARAIRKGIRRATRRAIDHAPVRSLIAQVGYLAVLGGGVFLALGILQLDRTVTSLLAGAGIIGLALGFAFQDIAENFIAGVLLSIRRPFTTGDLIESNDFLGHVQDVDLRSTHVRTLTGQLVRIPNGDVFGAPIINFSQSAARRVDLTCGVSYGDDLETAKRVALDAINDVEGRSRKHDVELFFEAFGGSSIDFVVRFWIEDTGQGAYLAARSDAIQRLKKAFDEAGVGIPFPIMTLDFSEAGTRRLDEPLRLLREG